MISLTSPWLKTKGIYAKFLNAVFPVLSVHFLRNSLYSIPRDASS